MSPLRHGFFHRVFRAESLTPKSFSLISILVGQTGTELKQVPPIDFHHHKLRRDLRLSLDLNLHALKPQLANLNTGPNRTVVGKQLLEQRSHDIEAGLHVDVVRSNSVDVPELNPRVGGLEGLQDVAKGRLDLLLNVDSDVTLLVPPALAGGADDAS